MEDDTSESGVAETLNKSKQTSTITPISKKFNANKTSIKNGETNIKSEGFEWKVTNGSSSKCDVTTVKKTAMASHINLDQKINRELLVNTGLSKNERFREKNKRELRRERGKFEGHYNKTEGINKSDKNVKRKGPNKKPNHDVLYYDIDKMPFDKAFELLGSWKLPDGFKASKIKIKMTEDSDAPWTSEHDCGDEI